MLGILFIAMMILWAVSAATNRHLVEEPLSYDDNDDEDFDDDYNYLCNERNIF